MQNPDESFENIRFYMSYIIALAMTWPELSGCIEYQLQSTALTPLCLMFYVWLPSEDLVNAVASFRLADTPGCHG